MTHEWHMNDITHTVQRELTLGGLQLTFLFCIANDFGQRKQFRRLLVVANCLNSVLQTLHLLHKFNRWRLPPHWIHQFLPYVHVYTWTIPVLFWLFPYYAHWHEVPIILKIYAHIISAGLSIVDDIFTQIVWGLDRYLIMVGEAWARRDRPRSTFMWIMNCFL